jgi:hypothetical protein
MPLRFVLDEDTRDTSLWRAISAHNRSKPAEAIDVVRVGDDGPITGTPDRELIEWAARENRIIVSRDRNTLIAAHDLYVSEGNVTPGLWILKRTAAAGQFVEFLALAAHCSEAYEFASRVEHVPPAD